VGPQTGTAAARHCRHHCRSIDQRSNELVFRRPSAPGQGSELAAVGGKPDGTNRPGRTAMKIEIRDAEAVSVIQPVYAALYLRANAWEQGATVAGRSSIWTRRCGDEEFEALLPLDRGLADYALRMGDLLSVLAIAESSQTLTAFASASCCQRAIVSTEAATSTCFIQPAPPLTHHPPPAPAAAAASPARSPLHPAPARAPAPARPTAGPAPPASCPSPAPRSRSAPGHCAWPAPW
jgi:hypothetical protein